MIFVNRKLELTIPRFYRDHALLFSGLFVSAWIEDGKIFLRELQKSDKRNMKFYISQLTSRMTWKLPKHWCWYYGFKKGSMFEIGFDKKHNQTLTLKPFNYKFESPEPIRKVLRGGNVAIPTEIINMAEIEPLGGVKLNITPGQIELQPEKINKAKYFMSCKGIFNITPDLRKQANFTTSCMVSVNFDGQSVIIKNANTNENIFGTCPKAQF